MPYTIAMLCIHTSPLDQPGRTKDAGGMNVYIRELTHELSHLGLNVDIFTRWVHPNLPQVVELAPGVRVIHIKAGPQKTLHKNDLYQYTPTFARHIEEFRQSEGTHYDIIHSHYWLSGVAAMRLACHWNVPHITMFHTLGKLKQQANPDEPEPALRLEMEQRLIHHVDRIIAATMDEKQQLITHCNVSPYKIEIIPCGVNLKLFHPFHREQAREMIGLQGQEPILLFAGRLDPFKGPDVLLRAAALMQEEAQIVIVGGHLQGDKDLSNLRTLAQELGINERTHFLGSQPRTKMPLFYSAATITVIPSYHESFGLAAVESLACGTPVIATRAGGLMTVVRDQETGYLVDRRPYNFAQRLDQLITDEQHYKQMTARARLSILQFGWQNVADQIQRVYDELTCKERSVLVP